MVETKGTVKKSTRRSPKAKEMMYVFGTFLRVLFLAKMTIRVPLPVGEGASKHYALGDTGEGKWQNQLNRFVVVVENDIVATLYVI